MNLTEIYFRKKRKQLEYLTSYSVLYTALLVGVVLILLIFSFAVYRRSVLDPEVPITPVSKEEAALLADVTVETGVLIHDFSHFDMLRNTFETQATIWFYFDPTKVDRTVIDSFNFEKGQIISKTPPREIKYGDKVMLLYEIHLQFQGFLDYSHFPLDQHRLDLILVNPVASPTQVLYVTNESSVQMAEDMATEGWKPIGKSARYGYIQEDLSSSPKPISVRYQRTVFSFFFEHSTMKEASIIFVPLILMFLVGLLSLLVDMVFESSIIIELAVGSTLALVFYSMYIRTFTPATGIFTLVDAFYVLLTIFTSVIFLMQIFVLHYYRKKLEMTHLKEVLDYTLSSLNILRCCMFLFTLAVLILTVFYILIIR